MVGVFRSTQSTAWHQTRDMARRNPIQPFVSSYLARLHLGLGVPRQDHGAARAGGHVGVLPLVGREHALVVRDEVLGLLALPVGDRLGWVD